MAVVSSSIAMRTAKIYLELLQENLRLNEVLLVGYCLMSNHVHLIVIPGDVEGLAVSMKHTHGRFASYWNVVHNSSGHAWQGRYYSCPLDRPHLWEALRYTELNPMRAKLVTEATSLGMVECSLLMWSPPRSRHIAEHGAMAKLIGKTTSWREHLLQERRRQSWPLIRQCTHTGRPLGTQEFVHALKNATERCRSVPQKGGRPAKPRPDARQADLHFDP